MKFKGFVGESYKMASLPISAQRCVNWFPERQENVDASSNMVLQPTPGYAELVEIIDETLPYGSFTRGIYRTSRGLGGVNPETNGSIIIVIGPNVYWFKSDYSYQKIGSITNAISKVSMIDDGFGLIIADGYGLYRLEITTLSFARLSFELTDPSSVAFIDGYTISIGQKAGLPQNTFFWSDIYDNSSWSALNYANAEQSQDPITSLITLGPNIYLIGPNSYEIWTTTEDETRPFMRTYGISGNIGIHAPRSLCKIGNNIYMIGTTNQGSVSAYKSNGTQMVKISTIALDQEWSQNVTSDCTTWTESKRGHDFVYFNFDALNKTYVFDATQGFWHERASRDDIKDTLNRWEPNFGVQIADETIVGDRYSTKLYLLGYQYTTENTRNILRIRTTSHQNAEQKMILINSVRFDMETGTGITSEDPDRYTQAPVIMFKYSQDRARTWSSELRQEFGETGDYLKTVEYQRLGASRNFTVQFSISDACHTSIINAFIYPKVSSRSRNDG